MKKNPTSVHSVLGNGLIFFIIILSGCISINPHAIQKNDDHDMYDGPDKAAQFEFERTKDPATGKVPRERYLIALKKTIESKNSTVGTESLFGSTWMERGPTSDVVGPSNGNTRANSGIAAGRIRAIMVDSNDATHKTVFIGGIDGGLWKTTDITAAPPTWTLVNDFYSNLAIAAICQDPRPGFTNNMYCCTGESYFNADAVQGNGVFRSTDGGANWTLIPSTATFVNGTRIVCDYLGNVYLATRGSGLQRSTNASGAIGSITWTNITPTGLVSDICDLEISSTAVTGRLHVVSGIFSTQAYRYCNTPETVTAAGWTTPATAFPSFAMRAEIACSGNILYALPANNSYQVPTIYKSTDGGANWAGTGGVPSPTWASGQGWYALAVDINPSNTNEVIIGGLDTWKSTNAGATWAQLSTWVGTTPVNQYVHADVHKVVYSYGKILFASDGGVFYSADNGATIRDRNVGLRIKQFYSCAIHPSTTNYFLAGAQDNGVHQFSNAGLSTTVEVTGGDGMGVLIDQVTPANQFGNYVYNVYNRSTNSGAGWSGIAFYKGTNAAASYFGSFVNPLDYDNTNKIIYAGGDGGEFFRWTTATTTAAGNYFVGGSPTFPAGASIVSSITNFSGAKVSSVTVSPYTSNRVYFGTAAGRVVYIDAANTAVSGTAGTNITGGSFPAGATVGCVNTGTDDNHLICCFTNYGVVSVWSSVDGGTNWTSLDNNGVNLPDMPIHWCMFYPGDNTKAILGTETGVWETTLINGPITVWTANTTFPTVRTDMLKYRALDGTLIAATHGRGLWSTHLPIASDYFRSIASGNWNSPATWESSPVSDFSSGVVNPSTLTPDAGSNIINIRSGHTVTVTANVTTDQTFVNPGGALVVTGSILTVSSNGLTVQSDATGTGRIGNSTGTISGNVNVERYIANAGHRAWHLLSGKSVSGSQTIFQSWQESGIVAAGLGTWITSNLYSGANGFDQSSISSSVLTHNQAGPNWVFTMANTNVTVLSANQGYMLFVRGDRNYTPTLPTPTATIATTLRTLGTLNQGTQAGVTVSSTGSGYTLVGNPFASPIDFELFSGTANLNQSYYIWDAALTGTNGVGGFRLVTRTGVNTYTATPTTGSDNTLRYINLGQAFMLKATGANASVAFTEAHKAASTSIVPSIPTGINDQQITANLFIVHPGNVESLADGIRIRYNRAYNINTTDDADKIFNFAENIYLTRDNHKLILENRPMINKNDTIYLHISNTGIKDYRFKIEGIDFVQTDIPAWLEDRWLGTRKKLDLTGGVNNVDFGVTADPASSSPDRFRIVFVSAPVITSSGNPGISVFPNPVGNSVFTVQFTNMNKGIYQLNLFNTIGQVIMTQQFNHMGGTATLSVGLDKNIINGSYRLEIIKPDNSRVVKALMIKNN